MCGWSSVIPCILWLVGIRESLVHPNIFNISMPLEQVCAPVSGDWFFHTRFAQIWHGIRPSMIFQFSEMVVILKGSYGICPYSMSGAVLPIILASVHRMPSFPFPYYWVIDWCSVKVLVDPVLDPFTCLWHNFLKCPISPQLKQCSLAVGQFFHPLSPSGWDISLHPLYVLSLEILGVLSSWDCFCSDLTEPNVVSRTRLFRRLGGLLYPWFPD